MKKYALLLVVVVLVGVSLACALSAPEPTLDEGAISTAVAETEAASAGGQTPPTDEPAPTSEPTAEPTAAPTETPSEVYAPDPLGPGYTGFIFDFGTCYDFDSYQPVDSSNPDCDFVLTANGVLSPQNGALINGANVSFETPSKSACVGSDLKPDLLAPLSDLYLCFQTSQGSYGFFVERDLQLNQNRIIFDLYIFP